MFRALLFSRVLTFQLSQRNCSILSFILFCVNRSLVLPFRSEAGVTDPLSSQRLAKDDVEKDLTFELQSIVSDLRRVLQDMYDRDSQSIDQQKVCLPHCTLSVAVEVSKNRLICRRGYFSLRAYVLN